MPARALTSELETISLPPRQPKKTTTITAATTHVHAVRISCCASEYEAISAGVATPLRAIVVSPCVAPTPPGVTAVSVAIELAALLRMMLLSDTGMP